MQSTRASRCVLAVLASAFSLSTWLHAGVTASVADAAERSSAAAVRGLLKQGADVGAAQPDGMTALHWAALHSDSGGSASGMLLHAGANVRATTRLGGYMPLHLASEAGYAALMGPSSTAAPTSRPRRRPARRR